ncbi:MAG: S1 RNA-binding domain-containing protein [Defluviitaleaceae bacterium]|nr:S1 RNA-binding domain-containing protein [Defluviitaleaceae bacterium]
MSEKTDKMERLEVGAIVEGKVVNLKPFGAIVILPDNTQGLVHISHISASFVQNVNDYISVGDIVKVKILTIDPTTKKISLSIKEAARHLGSGDAPASVPSFSERSRSSEPAGSFEDKVKEWIKISNERHAGLNKRNKRR